MTTRREALNGILDAGEALEQAVATYQTTVAELTKGQLPDVAKTGEAELKRATTITKTGNGRKTRKPKVTPFERTG